MHFHIYVVDGVFEAVDGDDGDRSGKVILLARHGGGFSVDASVCIGADDRVGWSDCYAIAPVHRLPWKGCTAKAKIIYLSFILRIAPNRNREASKTI